MKKRERFDSEEELKEAFKSIDKENKGYITSGEIRCIFESLSKQLIGNHFDGDDVQPTDFDENKKIYLKDFLEMYK